jgi:hypothetical protein
MTPFVPLPYNSCATGYVYMNRPSWKAFAQPNLEQFATPRASQIISPVSQANDLPNPGLRATHDSLATDDKKHASELSLFQTRDAIALPFILSHEPFGHRPITPQVPFLPIDDPSIRIFPSIRYGIRTRLIHLQVLTKHEPLP